MLGALAVIWCRGIYRGEDMQDGVNVPALRGCIPDETQRDREKENK